jgi:hypothetical protein
MSHADDRPKPPVSERKRVANRANAQKSTGPRTAEGKARVSLNALTHGLTARAAVLPFENEDHFNKFAAALRAELRPSGFLQTLPAERVIDVAWKLRRAGMAQTEVACRLLDHQMHCHKVATEHGAYTGPFTPYRGADIVADGAEDPGKPAAYLRLDLYSDRLQRALLTALARLRQEQRSDADGDAAPKASLDVEVEVETDGSDGIKNKPTAEDGEWDEPIDLRSFWVEPSKRKPLRPAGASDESNSQNKATADVQPPAPSAAGGDGSGGAGGNRAPVC